MLWIVGETCFSLQSIDVALMWVSHGMTLYGSVCLFLYSQETVLLFISRLNSGDIDS